VCNALRSARRLVKGTGSLASFRGSKATGASGLGVLLGISTITGGDTSRVANVGRFSTALSVGADFEEGIMELLVSLFVAVVFPVDIIEPTKTDLGTCSTAEFCTTASFLPSLSFRRLVSGLCASAVVVVGDGERTIC
jgi:hypothetical protein